MKLAVCGKGGVGKTTFSGMLMTIFASEGYSVIGIDADPDPHLSSVFNIPSDEITPVTEIKELVEEKIGKDGGLMKLNPNVADIPEKYSLKYKSIKLLTLGSKKGGDGCFCRENVLVRRLMEYLLTQENEVVILDMAAGIEHLTRGTARLVDALIVVVEPYSGSIDTARKIQELAKDLHIRNLFLVLNKITNEEEKDFIYSQLEGLPLLGSIPFDLKIRNASLKGVSYVELESDMRKAVIAIKDSLVKQNVVSQISNQ
jgi:CO dehydrogenase maturation factor